MKVAIPREVHPGERRVALDPSAVETMVGRGFDVLVESGAGAGARLRDEAFRDAGAEIVPEPDVLWERGDLVTKVRPPKDGADGELPDEIEWLDESHVLVSLIWPAQDESRLDRLAESGASVFALDQVPRITRAQSMDVLSSMANIVGYRAVVDAASEFGRFMGPQTTAAGSTPPARVMVVGAGVAGLAAVATADGMGAIVDAFDTRESAREEVESLGANFVELEFDESGEGEGGYAKEMSEAFLEAERELFEEHADQTDIFITTASVPGKPAPKLLTTDAVEAMRPGSVVVDLAAEEGGNCEVTEPGETVEHDGVRVMGPTNVASRLPAHASHFFGRNVTSFLGAFGDADDFEVDEEDRVVREMMVARGGDVTWPPPDFEQDDETEEDEGAAAEESVEAEVPAEGEVDEDEPARSPVTVAAIVLAGVFTLVVGLYAPPDFVQHFTVFVLACFVGWQLVWNVTPSLHTPLMSVTNAISGIIVVGGLVQVTAGAGSVVLWLGGAAVLVATINVFGGFLVTNRMLGMFRAEDEEEGRS